MQSNSVDRGAQRAGLRAILRAGLKLDRLPEDPWQAGDEGSRKEGALMQLRLKFDKACNDRQVKAE